MPKTKKKTISLINCPHCATFSAETWDLIQEHITLDHTTVYEKVLRGNYTANIHYDASGVVCYAYQNDQNRLNTLFKLDLETEHGVTDNTKRDRLFALAYEEGHSSGYAEVALVYGRLVELIK
jgi:hypothetical protein